jgi:hypothetical protein
MIIKLLVFLLPGILALQGSDNFPEREEFRGNAQKKPEVIILTDIGGDTDDEQSLVRLLLYSDMLDLKAICVTSRLEHGQDIKPELVYSQIEGYREVYSNLLLHSSEFPSPYYLESIVKEGQGDQSIMGEGFDTEASDFIISVIDSSEGLVHIAVWGGLRELAQALWKVQETRTQEEVDQFCSKIQVHSIGDQDNYRDWILDNFRALKFIANGFAWRSGGGVRPISAFRGMYLTGDVTMQNGEWVKENIHGHGPLSDAYPLHGHGTDGMKEGDTPSFLGLIANGLNVPEKPEWGGWGGRYRLLSDRLYIDAPDFLNGTMNERHSVSRWRPAFQRDFMARVKWCVEPFENANHNPVAIVNESAGHQPLLVTAGVGDELVFDASESYDPDGDQITFNWFFYYEINFPGLVDIAVSADGSKCTVIVHEFQGYEGLHLILEITDSGSPSLSSYKRIIINNNR